LAILAYDWFRSFGSGRRMATVGLALAIASLMTFAATQTAQAERFNVIYTFTDQNDGATPYAGLTIDRLGNLYGTTSTGGAAGYGTVFELKRSGSNWTLSTIYSFTGGNDGAGPRARVVTGPDGALYGTTLNGGGAGCGLSGCGTVFRLACNTAVCYWKETVLHRFTGGTDGGQPLGDLTFDHAGNIYGTTQVGGLAQSCAGLGCGTVFQLSHSNANWTENVLHQFAGGNDGSTPNGGVVFDHSGNLYGTTLTGGSSNFGTVFQLTPSGSGWTNQVLYNFQNAFDGANPDTGAIFDAAGNLYGSTILGGNGQGGAVFELTPSGRNWIFKVVYGLTGNAGPFGNLSLDAAGNLYGTTYQDGAYTTGSGFELTPSQGSWTYTSLYSFVGGNDGGLPVSNLVFDSSGNMYGTASFDGADGYGVVFEITP
jgi:uncharacterized repeat protein (TIGR03803 family)